MSGIMIRRLLLTLLVALTGTALLTDPAFVTLAAPAEPYRYFIAGNPDDVVTSPHGGVALMGGGTDVDFAFTWLAERADGGDVLVLRTTGGDGYNAYIQRLAPVDSVETLVLRSRAASSHPFVLARIRHAEVIFFAGGDQAEYLDFWAGTPLARAIDDVAARGGAIGGTSAGLAILGGSIFSAANGTVYSREALNDPYNRRVRLANGLLHLPYLKNVVTDSHFSQRNRLGRLTVFVARLQQERRSTWPRGIGIDEATALLVDPAGSGAIVGSGRVFFLSSPGSPQRCRRGVPLAWRGIPLYRANAGDQFDLVTWRGTGGDAGDIRVRDGQLRGALADR